MNWTKLNSALVCGLLAWVHKSFVWEQVNKQKAIKPQRKRKTQRHFESMDIHCSANVDEVDSDRLRLLAYACRVLLLYSFNTICFVCFNLPTRTHTHTVAVQLSKTSARAKFLCMLLPLLLLLFVGDYYYYYCMGECVQRFDALYVWCVALNYYLCDFSVQMCARLSLEFAFAWERFRSGRPPELMCICAHFNITNNWDLIGVSLASLSRHQMVVS